MLVRLSGLVGKTETKQEKGRKKETGGTEGAESRKLLLTKVRICRQEGLGGHGAAHVACTPVQRPNMPDDAILVKKYNYCSVIARVIYSGHHPQTDSSGLMWIVKPGRATVLWSVNQRRGPLLCSLD